MVKLVKINMTGDQEKSSSDQVLTPPSRFGEPRTSDDPSTLGPYVIASFGLLTKMINEWLKLWPSGGKQGFPVQRGTQCLVGGAHASVSP
jgi:hypothetical protein